MSKNDELILFLVYSLLSAHLLSSQVWPRCQRRFQQTRCSSISKTMTSPKLRRTISKAWITSMWALNTTSNDFNSRALVILGFIQGHLETSRAVGTGICGSGIPDTYLGVIDFCICCGPFHTCGKYFLMFSGKTFTFLAEFKIPYEESHSQRYHQLTNKTVSIP